MEREEQEWEQDKVEEEEEAGSLHRKPRSVENNGSEMAENVAVDPEENNYKGNGIAGKSTVTENGVHEKESSVVVNGVHKEEPTLGGFLEKDKKSELEIEEIHVSSDEDEGLANHGSEQIISQKFVVMNSSTSNSHGQSSQVSYVETYKPSEDIVSEDSDLITVDDLEETDLDVERVLQTQTTHDLYCPNCNSCITRRVILRKRKRRVKFSEEEVQRTKTEIISIAKKRIGSVQVPDHVATEVDAADKDSGPDLFRCLSCFSFFIPTGDGFKLFRMFRDKSRKENVQEEQESSRKKNWFVSMFASKDRRMDSVLAASSGSGLVMTAENISPEEHGYQILPSHEHPSNGLIIRSSGLKSEKIQTEKTVVQTGQFEAFESDQLERQKISKEVQGTGKGHLIVTALQNTTGRISEESAKYGISHSQKDVLNLGISSKDVQFELFESDQLEDLKVSKEVPVTGESHVTVTSIINSSEIISEESVQDAISHSQKGVLNLGISSKDVQFEVFESDQLKGLKVSKEVPVTGESHVTVTTVINSSEISSEESVQDAISQSQKGRLNLAITSKDVQLPFKKSEEGKMINQKVSKEVPVPGESRLTVTTVINSSEIIGEESVQDSIWHSQKGRLNLAITSKDVQLPFKESEEGKMINQITLKGCSEAIPHEEQHAAAKVVNQTVVDNANGNLLSVNDGRFDSTGITQHIIQKTKLQTGETIEVDSVLSVKGNDAIITIDARPASAIDQIIQVPEETTTSVHTTTQIGVAVEEKTFSEDSKIEIIKSIVYGGLVESITSLSVVSSASGGNAATLNILALGMANLIGGLFVIYHNLWELKCDQLVQVPGQTANHKTQQPDRYHELLGQRENFILHAVICVLSYLLFGLLPVIVYGFSFQKSDDKELKLVVVGTVSLLCIILLSLGKAYVCRPPKAYLKTVVTYVMLGFMASGIAFAAGVLAERLLEKLGLFQSTSTANLLLPQLAFKDSAWASR